MQRLKISNELFRSNLSENLSERFGLVMYWVGGHILLTHSTSCVFHAGETFVHENMFPFHFRLC